MGLDGWQFHSNLSYISYLGRHMKQYHNGPIEVQKRSCTDSICLFIFFLLTIGLFGVATYSWIYGNFKQFTYAYDPDGKGCGIDYPNYPYIYFASPHVDSLWVTVCVSACPVSGDKNLKCQTNSVVKTCSPVNSSDDTKKVEIYDTSLVADTLCLPTSQTLQSNINEAIGSQNRQIVTLFTNYTLILVSLPIAIILALVLMILIRCLAGCFIYLLIFVTVASLIAVGAYILVANPSTTGYGTLSFTQDPKLKIIISIVCFLLALIIFVVVCCFRSRLSLASRVVEVSAVFVAANCGVVFVPFILFIVTVLFVAFWIIQALGFYSLGTPSHTANQYPYKHFQVSNTIMALMGVHIFYLFWGVFFLIETSNFLITGTAASWYYRRDSPYSQASQRYRWKHMGSVCVGSFFKALIGFIKFLYELLTPEKSDNDTSLMAKYKKCCDCICCLCLKLFDWINGGAYTVINITGDSYCTSALKSASLRLNNLASSAILIVLQTVFTVIIRVGITVLTILAAYIIANNVERYKSMVQDPTLILVIIGLLAFAVSSFFISVYQDAMQSIYTTFLLDVQAGGKQDKCPAELMELLEDAKRQAHIIS